MRLSLLRALAACVAVVTSSANTVAAQVIGPRPQHVVFGGVGEKGTDAATPFVIGYQYLAPRHWVFGLDIAGEGEQNDNTYGSSSIEQALSFNALVGLGARIGKHTHVGVSGLLGARETGKDCPESYLGYQCYADENPSISYTANVGVVGHIAYRHVMLGGRMTSVSTQALVGVAF
jgi:hypothetical protein